MILSKADKNSSVSFLQMDYILDQITSATQNGEILDMWSFTHSEKLFLLVTYEQ